MGYLLLAAYFAVMFGGSGYSHYTSSYDLTGQSTTLVQTSDRQSWIEARFSEGESVQLVLIVDQETSMILGEDGSITVDKLHAMAEEHFETTASRAVKDPVDEINIEVGLNTVVTGLGNSMSAGTAYIPLAVNYEEHFAPKHKKEYGEHLVRSLADPDKYIEKLPLIVVGVEELERQFAEISSIL